jgi:enterochelin esterase family protein
VSRWAGAAVALVSAAAAVQSSPIVSGQNVTFVAAGDPSDPPRIVADFNGWEGGDMTPAGDGRTYSLRVTLDPAARIEYLIAYRNRFVLDPGNPLTVPAPAGPPRSELRMPGYLPAAPLPAPHTRGSIDEVAFTSRSAQPRRIRVYVPATSRRPLPMLYVHDGDIVLDALGLPAILDSLIDAGQMAPAFVTFIDAVDRHDDYEPGSPFRSVFIGEIVPWIERQYAVAPGRRALMGLSRSTVGALDACVNGGVAFEACALVAPAIPRKQFAILSERVEGSVAPRGTRFLIEAGTYDVPLVADARALRAEMEQRRLSVRYTESPQGHNHTAFRDRLPALMRDLFPTDK